MKDKRLFFGCFAKSLLVSLLLWGVAMGAMLWVNHRWCQEDIVQQCNDLPMRIRNGEVTLVTQPENQSIVREDGYCSAILTMCGESLLRNYGGQIFLRAYTENGDRLGQTQMLVGYSTMVGASDPEKELILYLVFDPVMTEKQMWAALEFLDGYPELMFYQGDAGASGAEFVGLRAVGWQEDGVLYVQKLALLFGTEEVVLVDSDENLFPDRATESYSSTWVEFYSPLLGRGDPNHQLERYRALETEVDEIEEAFPRWAQERMTYGVGWNSNAYLVANAVRPLAVNYDLPRWYAFTGLEPAALITLGAAVALALFTAWLETRAIRRERAFVRGAAHELKTPLAVLRTHAEALREDIDPAKRGQYLDTVVSESDRMAALVGNLMDLARLESGGKVEREPLDLSALVGNGAARLSLLAEEKGIELRTQLAPASLLGDRLRLEEVVDNLVDNALRHCPPGGAVTIALAQKGRRITLTVDNDGPVIPQKHLDRLFEPFYRGDEGRSRADGGTGLGLAIVRAAVEAHGGRCWAVNRTGGVTFTVVLPGLQSEK